MALVRYEKGGKARFDFRVPDGLGHWAYPDWDDPDLKVEFYDADLVLRATASVNGSLPLYQGNDYDPDFNPQGGPFVAVENIDLSDFALGVCEAWVYAKVGGVQVSPYPTVIEAFEVVAELAPGPLYTTIDRVKAEIPGTWPDSITDEMVASAIADMSRRIDAFLRTCYDTPFPDINDDPPTPPMLEAVCRKLAVHQVLLWMGRVTAASDKDLDREAMSILMWFAPSRDRAPAFRLPGYKGPVGLYQGELVRGDDQLQEDVLA